MTPLGWFLLLLAIVPVVWLWVYAIGDLMRRNDISTVRRLIWIGVVVLLPLVGGLLYLIFRPSRSEDIRGFGHGQPPRHRQAPPDDGSDDAAHHR